MLCIGEQAAGLEVLQNVPAPENLPAALRRLLKKHADKAYVRVTLLKLCLLGPPHRPPSVFGDWA